MKEYLLLFRGGDARMEDLSPEEHKAHMDAWYGYMGGLEQSGNLKGGLPLMPTGKLMCSENTVDGVVKDEKGNVIGGYLHITASNYDDAVSLTKACPIFQAGGNVEIREMMPMEG